ncbi:MAG: ATP-binding cassette domain-containing protein [Alkalispirochaeta sp.]
MTPVEMKQVAYTWPADEGEAPQSVFSNLTVAVPQGCTFLVGPNGIGKSTFLLLAGGRIFPDTGSVLVLGTDTARYGDAPFDPDLEQERNQLVSFVYQNMEFETDAPIGDVFEMVASSARDPRRAETVRPTLVAAADLQERLSAPMHQLSKGEMQRAIVVMSLLYGSPVVMMDEPLFAVEWSRAQQLLTAVREHCADTDTTVCISAHDVELARRFADNVVLFDTDGTVTVGAPDALLSRERLEQAFRAPYDTLYERQNLYRQMLAKGIGDSEQT